MISGTPFGTSPACANLPPRTRARPTLNSQTGRRARVSVSRCAKSAASLSQEPPWTALPSTNTS